MTDPLDQAPEPDDRPAAVANPAAAAAAPTAAARVPDRPRASGWGRVFRWWLGLSALCFVGVALCAWIGIAHFDLAPMHIVIDGSDFSDGVTINGVSDGARALLAVAVGLVALLALLLVPLLILLVLFSVAIAVICGVGVPLLAVAVVLAVVTAPIWVVGLLVWIAARRRDTNRLAASATMPA